ncbi:uncharacterized protein LOC142575569 isoform X5 [Dermacentor variabilis]|uniref:uncharacterized protein LOC142575569 isoform X5 n=1 Tax=Dermacentor variabilis TaxID=34621 RepID=UPI003F5AE2E1
MMNISTKSMTRRPPKGMTLGLEFRVCEHRSLTVSQDKVDDLKNALSGKSVQAIYIASGTGVGRRTSSWTYSSFREHRT